MTPDLLIRRLFPPDAEAYRALRLFGLGESPEAFGSDVATESSAPLDNFVQTLRTNYVAGAFAGSRLIAIAGFRPLGREKTRHRGDIWGVYVAPEARGSGVGGRIMEHLLDYARGRVLQVHLAVTVSNSAGVALYERLGFVRYGIEPRALKVAGRYLDEYLMVLQFE